MDQKISITRTDFFQAGKRSQIGFDLSESTPVFLSGPAGQGKEMMQALLTYWHLPNHPLIQSYPAHPNTILYQWSGAGMQFVSAHSFSSSKPIAILISGVIEKSWGKDTAIPPIRNWKKELEKEGRIVSKVLSGLEEWDNWLTHQKSPLSKKHQDIFPSPEMNSETLRLLRFRPEALALSWEQAFADRLLHVLEIPADFQQKILCYFQERKILQREEKLGRSLPGLRKWDLRKEQLRQERQLLTTQWPAIFRSHKNEREALQQNVLKAESMLPEEERLEQLKMRLGWIQWEVEQKTESPSAEVTPVDAPASWWQARKILAAEQQDILASVKELQNQLSISPKTESTEEEVRIDAQLRRLDQQLPEKIADLERLKMKLEWLRKEKEEEAQTLKEVHQSELARLQHQRQELEKQMKALESEAKRPRNTFRHWLEKNYPDWENGPGKVLHPSVLDSRGMFPSLERINDLFFGIKIHLEELPGVEQAKEKQQNPVHELEQIRHEIATFQIHAQHEEKLLLNRYKQKSRPLQKRSQQAEYDLQVHSRSQHQLRQRKKESKHQSLISYEKNRLVLQYRLEALQSTLEQLRLQIRTLDEAWDNWLEENSPSIEVLSLEKLLAQWKKEVTQQEKLAGRARKKAEASRLLAAACLDNWNLRDKRFLDLIESRELPAPDQADQEPASLTIEQWEQRWELMEAEEIQWDQEHQSWVEAYPALQEYLDLGLEEFEETGIAAKKSELARKWFEELNAFSRVLSEVREVCSFQLKTWKKWSETWHRFTGTSSLSKFIPEVHLDEHPLWRAIDMLANLIEDHQHAAAGAGLFNQQDPQQTLIRTLHILDNLYEGWISWKDGMTRMNLNILRLPGLHQPHRHDMFNYLYHLSLIFSKPGHIPGCVFIPEPERIPIEVITNMAGVHKWVICSQYPLAVKGEHLWVTEGKKGKSWEALPFAMG